MNEGRTSDLRSTDAAVGRRLARKKAERGIDEIILITHSGEIVSI